MLNPEERKKLSEFERLMVGSYYPWRSNSSRDFVVGIDARPLVALIDAAFCGARVYELMSIRRPGDLLHYWWVSLSFLDDEVIEHVRVRRRVKLREIFGASDSPAGMPFVDFDDCFQPDVDDNPPHVQVWLEHRVRAFWPERLEELLALVLKMQNKLRETSDFLLQHELSLIDALKHRLDFVANPKRVTDLGNPVSLQTSLPNDLFQVISELVKQDDVRSVSCALDDFAVWRVLVSEQVRRSVTFGVPLQEAFGLSGPDSGLKYVTAQEWGGEVHIPVEGACEGDLFIAPKWFRCRPEAAMGPDGRLSRVTWGKGGSYLLVNQDLGELDCATRQVIGDWILYRSKIPVDPRNPFTLHSTDQTS